MNETGERPMPVLGDVPLRAIRSIELYMDGAFVGHDVVGLEGTVQQRLGRRSHEIRLSGQVLGETYKDDLEALQNAAAGGAETTFTADIVSALELQSVVIRQFSVRETAGHPGRADIRLVLVEAPPLPPPAQVSSFGGLDDFGFGDLGFDSDIMGDLANLAGDISAAVDGALDAVAALDALAGLGDLSLDGPLEPLQGATEGLADAGRTLSDAASKLGGLFS
jgi:hypothetical protein